MATKQELLDDIPAWVSEVWPAGNLEITVALTRFILESMPGELPAVALVDLPCGCQDVYYSNGNVDREHDHVECDGKPEPPARSLSNPADWPGII